MSALKYCIRNDIRVLLRVGVKMSCLFFVYSSFGAWNHKCIRKRGPQKPLIPLLYLHFHTKYVDKFLLLIIPRQYCVITKQMIELHLLQNELLVIQNITCSFLIFFSPYNLTEKDTYIKYLIELLLTWHWCHYWDITSCINPPIIILSTSKL